MQQEACEKHYYLSYDLQLFAKEGQDGEKTEEPTAKKLEDARKKGQVMRSTEVVTAATLLAFFFMLKIFVGFIGNRFMTSFRQTIGFISDYTSEPFTLNTARTIIRGSFWNIIVAAFPIMIVGLVVTIVAIVFQVKWKVTAEPLKPKFDKFNPVTGMKRLFSKDKIMDLFKSIAKVVILAYVVYSYLKNQWPLIYKMYSYTLPQAIAVIGDTVINVGIRISALFAVIALFDLFYQKWKYHQDMMMSKQEVKDEYKNSEGDPKVKPENEEPAEAENAAGIPAKDDAGSAECGCGHYKPDPSCGCHQVR